MMFQEMDCSKCGDPTGAWFEPSGAPHYHLYYCEGCKNEEEEESELNGDDDETKTLR